MLADQLAYVALASNDPAATCHALERHFRLPRTEFASAEGSVPVFAVGRSALAVFPLGHSMLGGPAKPGVNHIALGVDDVTAAARKAAEAGAHAAGEASGGLGGRKTVKLDPAGTVGVRVHLTDRFALSPSANAAVQRIDHLGVASADVAEDEAVFARKLGFAVESRQTDMEISVAVESFTSDKYGVVYHSRPPELVAGLRDLFVTIGDCELEFLANFDPRQAGEVDHGQSGTTRQDQGAIARYVASRGRGLHHVAMKTPDIDALLASLSAAGMTVIDTKGRPGGRRSMIGFIHPKSTGGALMHLVQRQD
jgi:catechol 2,3-dioxygenase-like lactoylglutathione lyase family enzyme